MNLNNQYVCRVCGYNMVDYLPNNCPFYGASKIYFITAKECSKQHDLKYNKIKSNVYQIISIPRLGLEHAAYQIETENGITWIDCPSTYKRDLKGLDNILFTHHHFLGASNLYREYYNSKLHLHIKDSQNALSKYHKFDALFNSNFEVNGIESFHINGHTNGFTFYMFEKLLFVCDYVLIRESGYKLNPYGLKDATIQGARKMKQIIDKKEFKFVCGVDYFVPYDKWYIGFEGIQR